LNVTITPRAVIVGEITAPPSKAHTHRALFAGLLSEGATKIENPLSCADTDATANAVSSLGAGVERGTKVWVVQSNGHPKTSEKDIDCGESGVTLRFTIPIASLAGGRVTLVGRESLMRRPIEPLVEAMNQLGVKVVASHGGVRVEGGPPKGGKTSIRGDVSSQFISGLLFAAPVMEKGLHLQLSSPLESRSYVTLTVETMKRLGINISADHELSLFEIPPGQRYRPVSHLIPGDYSSAAFAMAAAAITSSRLLVRGLPEEGAEPDSEMLQILSQMGVQTSFQEEGVAVESGRLKASTVDVRDCPDLGPVTAVLGCYA
jgi:3-phosphoshikimate 1-carboxyvinyltransferase